MAKIFDFIRGFSRTEKGMTEPDKLDVKLMMVMHFLRAYLKSLDPNITIIIHKTVATSGHSKSSQHYPPRCCAMDFHIHSDVIPYKSLIQIVLNFLEFFNLTEQVGLGIYPDWNSPGFHLDTRGTMARWGYLLKENEEGKMAQTAVSFEEAQEYALAA